MRPAASKTRNRLEEGWAKGLEAAGNGVFIIKLILSY